MRPCAITLLSLPILKNSLTSLRARRSSIAEAPGKTLRGILQVPEEYDGKLHVRVQVHSRAGGALTYLLDESRALQVQPARHSGKLPKNKGRRERPIRQRIC